jgi:anti-sigma regulatory factor (Ser/Thr protein kinase)
LANELRSRLSGGAILFAKLVGKLEQLLGDPFRVREVICLVLSQEIPDHYQEFPCNRHNGFVAAEARLQTSQFCFPVRMRVGCHLGCLGQDHTQVASSRFGDASGVGGYTTVMDSCPQTGIAHQMLRIHTALDIPNCSPDSHSRHNTKPRDLQKASNLFLLAEDPPEEDRRAFVKRLRAQLGRIQWLVAALLKLARLDAGTAAFKIQVVDVRRLIERALEPLRIPLEIKRQHLEVRGEADASFTGDLNWSAEALTNVVKNCVEHTPEGGKIEITYSANALYAEITVSDDGEGIASSDLPNIFNRFYRSANATENNVGIGLALAKAILTAQGGDISVRSERGTGTSFTIRVFRGVV